jgi:hypothetical protein
VEEMRKFALCLVMLLMVASPASACIGARQAAMGWCGVAISDDATCSYWNPAALVWAKDGVLWENISHKTVFAIKEDNCGFHYVDAWDKTYFAFSYAVPFVHSSSFGINIGVMEQDYLTSDWMECFYRDGKRLSLDLSYFIKYGSISCGLLAQDLGNIRPGLSYSNNFLVAAVEYYDMFDVLDMRCWRFGIELNPVSPLSLRFGYNEDDGNSYGIGFEVSFGKFDVVLYRENFYYSISLFL